MALTVEMVREAFYADLLSLPFHRHLGVEIDPQASGETRVSIPPKPEITGPDGQQSPAAVFTLGEAACSVEMCDAIASRALEMGMGAIFLTVSSEFRPRGRPRGTITASTSLVKGLEGGKDAKRIKKATIVAAARIVDGSGDLAAEQQVGFHVRFMDERRMRELVPTSEVGRLIGS